MGFQGCGVGVGAARLPLGHKFTRIIRNMAHIERAWRGSRRPADPGFMFTQHAPADFQSVYRYA